MYRAAHSKDTLQQPWLLTSDYYVIYHVYIRHLIPVPNSFRRAKLFSVTHAHHTHTSLWKNVCLMYVVPLTSHSLCRAPALENLNAACCFFVRYFVVYDVRLQV